MNNEFGSAHIPSPLDNPLRYLDNWIVRFNLPSHITCLLLDEVLGPHQTLHQYRAPAPVGSLEEVPP